MDTDFNVIIVGAGPAGTSCAYNLKRFNPQARVLLIDKAIFPRYKVCGGGISPEVVNYFDFDLNETIDYRCNESVMVANGQRIYSQAGEILMVRREVFDHLNQNKAIQRGVETLMACDVIDIESPHAHPRVKTRAGDFSAQVVVIAEDRKSV